MRYLSKHALCVVLALGLLASCNSTSVVSQWSSKEATGKPLAKVLVCTPLVGDAATRRRVEDQLAASFPPTVKAVPSYTVFPDAKVIRMANKDKIAARLQQDGFDGALVTAVDSATRREVYVPPQVHTSPGGFYGYRGWGGYAMQPMSVSPGYTYTESRYLIETVLFSIPDGHILWTMTTESVNPDSRQQVVKEVSGIIHGTLKEQGFIP